MRDWRTRQVVLAFEGLMAFITKSDILDSLAIQNIRMLVADVAARETEGPVHDLLTAAQGFLRAAQADAEAYERERAARELGGT